MMKCFLKINLQEPQRNRNATANFVNLIMTSTVLGEFQHDYTLFTSIKSYCSKGKQFGSGSDAV